MSWSYSSTLAPASAASSTSNRAFWFANAAAWSPAASALYAGLSFHSGCRGAAAFTRSSMKTNWKYSGCSAHSVPSLSNTAMRSSFGTNDLLPSRETSATKSVMAAFAGPSRHDGSGSPAGALAPGPAQPAMAIRATVATPKARRVQFEVMRRLLFHRGWRTGRPRPNRPLPVGSPGETCSCTGRCRGGRSAGSSCRRPRCRGTSRRA